jgi:DNA replication protein DnaC
MNLFPGYADKTLEEFQTLTPSHEEALRRIQAYTSNLIEMRKAGYGLTILGPQGVGKTHLAQMVLKQAKETVYKKYIASESFTLEKKYTVESIEAETYISLHQKLMDMDKREDYEEYGEVRQAIRQLETAHFVLFDDVGREHNGSSDWTAHLLYNIVKFRYHRSRPFLITSNLPLEALAERYTKSFTSVLHEKTDVITITGEDFRCGRGN